VGVLLFNSIPECPHRQLYFTIAFIGWTISAFLLGPIFHVDDKSNYPFNLSLYRWISFALSGFFQVFVFNPAIPEIIERT
jgi:hypothetical protein